MREFTPRLFLLNASIMFIGIAPCDAQKLLLIEKAGNPKTERIQLYDEITFTLKGDDKLWYKRQILDMDPNAQLVLLGDTWTALDDIGRLRLKRQRTWANLVGGALQGGGASMILGDLYYTLVTSNTTYNWAALSAPILGIEPAQF